ETVMMGSDYYDPTGFAPPSGIPLGIGKGCLIEGAILDKNARLGPGVVIRPFPRGTDLTQDNWFVRDGIVVIPKNTSLPAETFIGPRE
ncbi:MAG TPA: glucose-1-phosphate adenylyltransferase, partial [Anaerolineae bacterium]|nr:glucose-1-phosphate adenylyltransferase [Anaerolineae bacterium]